MTDLENELRDVFRERAGDVRLPPQIPGPVARRVRRREWRTGAIAAVVALAIGAGSLGGAAAIRSLRSRVAPIPAASIPADWPTFNASDLRFRYPPAWVPTRFQLLYHHYSLIVLFSNQAVHNPCYWDPGGGSGGCSGGYLKRLNAGGFLIEWAVASPGHPEAMSHIATLPGQPTMIGGRRAGLTITKPGDCRGYGADESITAYIATAPESSSTYVFNACLKEPGVGAAEAEVRLLLSSVVFKTD